MDIDTKEELQLVGKPYQPNFPAEAVSGLGRQETMDVLLAVEHIATTLEDCASEIPALEEKLKAEQAAAEDLRDKLSKPVARKLWIITIGSAVIGTFIIPVLFTAVFGIAAYLIAFAKIGKPDLEKHQAENNLAADAYIRDHVTPVQNQISALLAIQDDILNNGRRAWAIEIIGEDLFYSVCIHDLYQLIKSRRADNLKEALNKYDDEQYKARMQEIQENAQRAAEAAAAEAKKQTKQLSDIQWNTSRIKWNTFWTRWNTKRR